MYGGEGILTYMEGCWMKLSSGELAVTPGKGTCRALVEKNRKGNTSDASREAAGIGKKLTRQHAIRAMNDRIYHFQKTSQDGREGVDLRV